MSTGIIMRVSSMSSNESYVFEFLEEDRCCYCAVPGSVVRFTDNLVCSEKECRFHKSVWMILTCDAESSGFEIIMEKYNRMNLV